MNRREVLITGAAGVAAATLATPQEHAHTGPLLAPETVVKQGAAWKPAVFTPAQNETVVMLTELIIPATDTPGAKAAMVNRYLDLFLANSSQPNRDRFLKGLDWLDAYVTKQHGKPFAKLTEAEQVAILQKLDGEQADTELADGHRFFRMIKGATSQFYYQTEIGFKELNKGGVPRSFGCDHKEHDATGQAKPRA